MKFPNGTAQDRRRRRTIERPSEAATGSSRRIVNRVRRCSPVIKWVAGVTAGPGEAGWNPVDVHTRRTSCHSPLDPIEGDAPGEGTFFPRRSCRNSYRHRDGPRGLSGAGTLASAGASRPSSGRGSCGCRRPGPHGPARARGRCAARPGTPPARSPICLPRSRVPTSGPGIGRASGSCAHPVDLGGYSGNGAGFSIVDQPTRSPANLTVPRFPEGPWQSVGGRGWSTAPSADR